MPGVPLGSFGGSSYDEVTVDLHAGDVWMFCSDGIFETWNDAGDEFGAARLIEVVERHREAAAKDIVAAVFNEMSRFRGGAPQTDDQTAVVVKITS